MKKTTKVLINFQWVGINRSGKICNGIIGAEKLAIARAELQQQGIIIRQISKKRNFHFNRNNKPIRKADLALFSRQMATLIDANIPILQSLRVIIRGMPNERMKFLLEAIKKEVESGAIFADALRKHPTYFNHLYCNLIAAGEQSGTLDLMLEKVATYQEKIETIKKKIKKAIAYPISVILVAFVVSAGLLIYVVPQFESLFENFGAKLPPLTRGVITLSDWFLQYYPLLFGIVSVAIFGFIYAQKHSLRFTHLIDKMILKLPLVGPILESAAIARFTRTLSITFAAGLPLFDALNACAGVTGNLLYSNAIQYIRRDIASGQQLYLSMDNAKLFPSMVIQMVEIGEESGALEKMLGKVADFYEEAVDNAVDELSSILEPLIMSILGILIGGLVIAMYLPIFKLGSVV